MFAHLSYQIKYNTRQWIALFALAVSAALWGATPVAAQATGSIAGVVTDESAAPVSGIQVYISQLFTYETGSFWTTITAVATDPSGAYTVAELAANTYRVALPTPIPRASTTRNVTITHPMSIARPTLSLLRVRPLRGATPS